MLNFVFLEKGLWIVSPPHFAYEVSKKMFLVFILLTDQMLLSHCFSFLKYCAICTLQLFVNQVLIKSQDKNLMFCELKELLM